MYCVSMTKIVFGIRRNVYTFYTLQSKLHTIINSIETQLFPENQFTTAKILYICALDHEQLSINENIFYTL